MKNKYSFLTNEELVDLVRSKDDNAFAELQSRFSRFIKFKCRYLFIIGAERCDVEQEALIALYKAALSFCTDLSCRFATYASSCINNHLKRILEASNKKGNRPFHDYVSYDDDGFDSFKQLPEARVAETPETYAIKKDMHKEILTLIGEVLTEHEKNVLMLFIKGMSYNDIADYYRISQKSVDNALQRARKKIADCMKIKGYF